MHVNFWKFGCSLSIRASRTSLVPISNCQYQSYLRCRPMTFKTDWFACVEPRTKSKSCAKSVVKCLSDPPPRAKPGNPACLTIYIIRVTLSTKSDTICLSRVCAKTTCLNLMKPFAHESPLIRVKNDAPTVFGLKGTYDVLLLLWFFSNGPRTGQL